MRGVHDFCEHMFVKPEARAKARSLRREQGMSMREIASKVGVSLSTVSRWTRGMELSPAQHAVLSAANHRHNAQVRGQEARARSARAARAVSQTKGRRLARRPDALHVQGCMLYWAEGSKSRNVAALTNSDPDLLSVFVRFLRECYAVPDCKLALTVNCHLGNGMTVEEIQGWWLHRLDMPSSCGRAAAVNRPSAASRGRRGNVLPYGTARVSVCSTELVQSIYGAIQEYAGIDRPEWLD